MPVPLYLSGVFIIFAFLPRSKFGIFNPLKVREIFDLILNPAVSGKHFETASLI